MNAFEFLCLSTVKLYENCKKFYINKFYMIKSKNIMYVSNTIHIKMVKILLLKKK